MGNLLLWDESPSDSSWVYTEIYRASTETGTYSKIDTLDINDFTYYDENGASGDYYKIRFTNTDGSLTTDYSDAMQGSIRYLYTDPKDVLRIAGLTTATLPSTITNNTIYDWIYDISKDIDKLTKKVFGRTESFEEICSSNYMNVNASIILNHRQISDVSVYFRQTIQPDDQGEYTWNEKNEGFDFQVFPEGRIKLYTYPVFMQPYNYQDIKITGTYGQTDIPSEIEQMTKLMTAIRIFVHITGGSYNDVTSWSLGEYNESLGEPYTNLRATIDMILQELKRLKERTGISDKLVNFRIA